MQIETYAAGVLDDAEAQRNRTVALQELRRELQGVEGGLERVNGGLARAADLRRGGGHGVRLIAAGIRDRLQDVRLVRPGDDVQAQGILDGRLLPERIFRRLRLEGDVVFAPELDLGIDARQAPDDLTRIRQGLLDMVGNRRVVDDTAERALTG